MSKKKESSGKKGTPKTKRSIKSSLINFLKTNPKEALNYKQIAARLGYNAHAEREILMECLQELLASMDIEESEVGKFVSKNLTQYVIGKVDMTKTGSAYVICEDLEGDVFVAPKKLGSALHGDTVKVLLYAVKSGKKMEGEVVEVLERRKIEFTGTLQVKEKFAFLLPDYKRMAVDIFVPINLLNGGKDGEKVLVKIVEWHTEGGRSPIGKVVRILGKPGEHITEMNTIIAEFELPEAFPDNVVRESEAISSEITSQEIAKRRDFRGITTFTIDPFDAKDFDDALSIRAVGEGLWEIGIHIADVSHYVREGTALDKEALDRGTSVYLVDRVIPMLPENLSNHLCSLRPDEDKLTFSVVVVMNEKAELQSEWYGRTVIRSIKRFSYEDAQEILETGVGEYVDELKTLNSLALILKDKRFEEGAISFETEEVKFQLDETGVPVSVYKKIRKDAHKLIEEFMLLANRKVAEFAFKKNEKKANHPFVYRVHDSPDTEKLNNFVKLANQFGYRMKTKNDKELAQSFNKLLLEVEGKPEQNMLQNLAIRTMSKAIYTTHKSSHYGLAFQYYTHFTSPIRRYPDVMVHRLLANYLSVNLEIDQDLIEQECKQSSNMEVRAAEAERASIKYKQVQYLSARIGQEFNGIISGVTEWGIYVELLDNKCEGMVRISQLKDDYYVFDVENYRIRGFNTGKTYRLGDVVMVKVVSANLRERTIDFAFKEG